RGGMCPVEERAVCRWKSGAVAGGRASGLSVEERPFVRWKSDRFVGGRAALCPVEERPVCRWKSGPLGPRNVPLKYRGFSPGDLCALLHKKFVRSSSHLWPTTATQSSVPTIWPVG